MNDRDDPFARLRRLTAARIGLGRAGDSLPTAAALAFAADHAAARDAVHTSLDVAALQEACIALGCSAIPAQSQARDRAEYLRRPDLGRRLAESSRQRLGAESNSADLVIVFADGLAANAVQQHAPELLRELLAHWDAIGTRASWRLGPVVIATQARVALGDEIAQCLGANAVAVFIGERPGLSAADSLGVYLTWQPRADSQDAERNCISNIRPQGQPPRNAAARLAWLLDAARSRGLTGVSLKDDSGVPLLANEQGQRLSDER